VNASELLTWISAAILLQLAVGIAIAARRKTPPGQASLPAAASPPAGAWSGWREFRVIERSYEDRAHTQCSFRLEPLDRAPLPPFRPGQFLTFALRVLESNQPSTTGGAITRCYSLSGGPDPSSYRITVKRIPASDGVPAAPAGAASSFLHDRTQIGAVLKVRAPAGHFYLESDESVPIVLISGGIGITPMLSMLAYCSREQPQRAVHLYYGIRNGEDHAFRPELEHAASQLPNFKLHVVYSRPQPGDVAGSDYHHRGHVDLELIRATLPHGRHQFYICGPSGMMQSLVPALVNWGVPAGDVRFEAFGPASVRLPMAEAGATTVSDDDRMEVHFRRSGRTLTWEGRDESLLEFGERHGIVLESGCRSGSCGACESRLVSGQVRYPHRPDHDAAPGHCLPCLARPASALTIEA
jgi:ferredoxin-NADP reductase